jgi:Zn finger protein HypA/HybF involved in hydrogenase expression
MVSTLGGGGFHRGRTTLATNETFCTECQRVAYIADDARLECPVCSSPLLATIEEEAADVDAVEELRTAG